MANSVGSNNSAKVVIREGDAINSKFIAPIPQPDVTPGPQGPDGFGELHDDFVTTNGQTIFALTKVPADPDKIILIADHLVYEPNVDFSIVGNVITWFGAPTNFDFVVGQDVRVYYTDN